MINFILAVVPAQNQVQIIEIMNWAWDNDIEITNIDSGMVNAGKNIVGSNGQPQVIATKFLYAMTTKENFAALFNREYDTTKLSDIPAVVGDLVFKNGVLDDG